MGTSSMPVGRRPHKVDQEDRKPFITPYSFSDLFGYPEKVTGNQLIDAVSEAIYTHKFTTAKEVAEYLNLEQVKLNHALQVFVGSTLGEIVSASVFFRVEKYIKEHPEETLDQVAKATGYNSRSAISYIYKRFGKGAPRAEENKK
jgi:transcriptional regulator GlxA family with amidase domain